MPRKHVWVIEYRRKGSLNNCKSTKLCEDSKMAASATAKYIQKHSPNDEYNIAKYVREEVKGA